MVCYMAMLLIVLSGIRISQSGVCYSCTGEGLDHCSRFTNQMVEQCRNGAFGCGIAAGILPNKHVITVERKCLYEHPAQYCKRIKSMVHSQNKLDHYCKTCQWDRCNSDNISSIINRLQLGPVTVDNYLPPPTKNPCRK
ncbi:hypothetical protein HHI36_009249 [Cryptolaemus montrouzieri]|uniref:Uncharacterized protein n=1 Tax=Cryptolaemus montrouzieri TaxID=559131 RepID=A0ABD2MVB5_9CUCU